MRGHWSQWFSHKMNNRHPLNPRSRLELPAKQHCRFCQFGPILRQCCLAGSSKNGTPKMFIFSIVLGAEYSFYVKSIANYYTPTFLGYNNSVLAIVLWLFFQPKFFLLVHLRLLKIFRALGTLLIRGRYKY